MSKTVLRHKEASAAQLTEAIRNLEKQLNALKAEVASIPRDSLEPAQPGPRSRFTPAPYTVRFDQLVARPSTYPPSPHSHDFSDLPISSTQVANWEEAHGWGDHSLAGYLTTVSWPQVTDKPTEFPPESHSHSFTDLPISSTQVANWDTAYTWGDHSTVGYLTTVSWGEVTAKPTEFPPEAHSHTYADLPISSTQVANWDTAYTWGDHSTVGYLTTVSWGEVTAKPTEFPPEAHSHAIADVTGLQTSLNAKIESSEKGSANGVATLDSNAKVPLVQLPDGLLGQVEYQGTWNADTNTPTLPLTPEQKGDYYVTTTAGTFDGKTFAVGDWIISNGTSWDKVDNTDAVSSVAGRTGHVTLTASDVSGLATVATTGSYTDLSNVPTNFPPSSHTHGYADLPISSAQVSNWNTAFGWGDHASAGYANGTENDFDNLSTRFGTATHPDTPFNASNRYVKLHNVGGFNTNNATSTGTIAVKLAAPNDNAFINARIVIGLNYNETITVECGGYLRSSNDWTSRWCYVNSPNQGNKPDLCRFVVDEEGYGWILLSNENIPTASEWRSYINITLESIIVGWTGGSDNVWRDPKNYQCQLLETEPTWSYSFNVTPVENITTNNAQVSNWDTAYDWGDHASAGYLTSVNWTDVDNKPTEFKPESHTHSYADLPISSNQVSNWNTAYDWGDHASAGYLTSVNWTDVDNKPTEFKPESHTHSYADLPISSNQVSNWNTAFGWGDHASAGYMPSFNRHDWGMLADRFRVFDEVGAYYANTSSIAGTLKVGLPVEDIGTTANNTFIEAVIRVWEYSGRGTARIYVNAYCVSNGSWSNIKIRSDQQDHVTHCRLAFDSEGKACILLSKGADHTNSQWRYVSAVIEKLHLGWIGAEKSQWDNAEEKIEISVIDNETGITVSYTSELRTENTYYGDGSGLTNVPVGSHSHSEYATGDNFNSTGDYSGLRARATTLADVGAAASNHSHSEYATGDNFNSTGDYSGLRARATTLADVGAAASSHTHNTLTPTQAPSTMHSIEVGLGGYWHWSGGRPSDAPGTAGQGCFIHVGGTSTRAQLWFDSTTGSDFKVRTSPSGSGDDYGNWKTLAYKDDKNTFTEEQWFQSSSGIIRIGGPTGTYTTADLVVRSNTLITQYVDRDIVDRIEIRSHTGASGFQNQFEFGLSSSDLGDFRARGDVIASYSDERLKDVVEKLSNSRELIRSWEAFKYTPSKLAKDLEVSNSDRVKIGLSAQSVQATHSELVAIAPFDRGDKGKSLSGEDYLTLRYDRITAVLVNAVNEQSDIIDNQQDKIDDLESRLVYLEKLLGSTS